MRSSRRYSRRRVLSLLGVVIASASIINIGIRAILGTDPIVESSGGLSRQASFSLLFLLLGIYLIFTFRKR